MCEARSDITCSNYLTRKQKVDPQKLNGRQTKAKVGIRNFYRYVRTSSGKTTRNEICKKSTREPYEFLKKKYTVFCKFFPIRTTRITTKKIKRDGEKTKGEYFRNSQSAHREAKASKFRNGD